MPGWRSCQQMLETRFQCTSHSPCPETIVIRSTWDYFKFSGVIFFIFDPKRCIKKGSPEDNRSAKLPYPDSRKKEGLETTMKQHWGGQGITTTTALMESQYMGTKCLSLISWIRCKSKSILPHILQRPRPEKSLFAMCLITSKKMWDLEKRTNRIKSVVRVQRKDRKSNLGLMIRT